MQRVIAQYKTEMELFLADGGAEDMNAYNRIVGRYEGLKTLERELDELEKRLKDVLNEYSPILEGVEVEDLKEKVKKLKPATKSKH